MMGTRERDAIRQLPNQITALGMAIAELREDNKVIKDLLRSVKKTLVRKYGEEKEDAAK